MFAEDKLHIIDTFSMGVINVNNELPLILKKYKEPLEKAGELVSSYETIILNMNEPTEIDDASYPSIKKSIQRLSEVISTVVPELKLNIEDYGIRINGNNFSILLISSSTLL